MDQQPEPHPPDSVWVAGGREQQGVAGEEGLSREQLRDLIEEDYLRRRSAAEVPWPEVGVGVALAAGAFPAVLMALYVVVGIPIAMFSGFVRPPSLAEVLGTLAGVAGGIVIVGGAAFFIAGMAAAVILPVVALAAHLLDIRARQTVFACAAGGLATFLVCAPGWLNFSRQGGFEAYLGVALFPGLATLFGQFGAGYLAMSSQVATRRRPLDKSHTAVGEEPVRFSLKQILWSMVLASILLAVMQVTGFLRPDVFATIAVWLAYQFAPLWGTVRLVDRKHRKLVARLAEPADEGCT